MFTNPLGRAIVEVVSFDVWDSNPVAYAITLLASVMRHTLWNILVHRREDRESKNDCFSNKVFQTPVPNPCFPDLAGIDYQTADFLSRKKKCELKKSARYILSQEKMQL